MNMTEEYSPRGFWAKVKEAIKKATLKIKGFFKMIGKEVMESAKEVASAAAKAALEKAKEKAKEKAIVLVNKMFEQTVSTYSTQGSENDADFVKYFCERMDIVGQRLVEHGKKRLTQ
ncbi:hypothetical protein V5799_030906 [Amblyomma americanum]|uniref:Uncharacterized protein n=1 Tax=Amblyomma americanum TaxID=6943 RepID=A0AAQ4EM09_AMBAM